MTTKKTAAITAFEATPRTMTATQNAHGRIRTNQGSVALLTTDIDAGDIIHLAVLPAEASIIHIWLGADDMDDGGGALTFDLGVYTIAGVAKDINAFADAITLGQSASKPTTDFANQVRDIDEIGQKLFLDAGDTLASHDEQYYISLTGDVVADTAAAGDISWIIEYVVD